MGSVTIFLKGNCTLNKNTDADNTVTSTKIFGKNGNNASGNFVFQIPPAKKPTDGQGDQQCNDRVAAKTRRRCRALYDCCADQRDELSFTEGEIIVIISEITEDDQWMEGMIEGEPHRRGVFPTSFVHMLSD